MGYITKRGVDVRVARAVKRALAKERRARPHVFTRDTFLDHNRSQHAEGFRQGQAVLRETHVVLTKDELASRLESARDEVEERFERSFPHMMTPGELQAHDAKVREECASELRTAFDAELFAKCEEAGIAATEATVEATKRMIATALSGCNFEVDPEFMSGLGFLAESLLEQAQKHQSTSPQAKFGFHFAQRMFAAMK